MTKLHHEHLWEMVCCAVDKMSVTKTAAVGGTGSVLSLATAAAPDLEALNAYLHTAALGAGALGAILSVGLVALKTWLEIKRHRASVHRASVRRAGVPRAGKPRPKRRRKRGKRPLKRED